MDITSFHLENNDPIDESVADVNELPAWEMVEEGRYRPRRIRGSCVGRELG